MPLTIRELFAVADLHSSGVTKWGELELPNVPGVYCVSLAANPDSRFVDHDRYSPSPSAFAKLLSACPKASVDGVLATPSTLADRIGRFWIPNEPLLYIGMASTSIRSRVEQYYSTELGARAPHAGGWWLKTLESLDQLYVHFASCDDVSSREQTMLAAFAASVEPERRRQLFDVDRVAPFANVDIGNGQRKRHGLLNCKVSAHSTPSDTSMEPDDASPAELWVHSQPVTDKDRTRSFLRIPAESKHAFPSVAAQLQVVLDDVQVDVRWRPNGTRSGTLYVGVEYMRGLREHHERLPINVNHGIYTILSKSLDNGPH
ncbi:hypothetical protein QMQ05_15140 [Glutamicibacter ectropisis]|uniref:GIY-YIG domain-containing protein n=1 Tax=Glutamicibacter ectropisis TaxID=3046593 RepID=A0AAU6WEH4_9MICC